MTDEQIAAKSAAEWAGIMRLNGQKKWWALAAHLMKIIWYDNGGLVHRESDMLNTVCRTRIAKSAAVVFESRPDLLTYDNMELLGAGDYDEVKALFADEIGYKDLDEALNEYFQG